jgi:hypothetical protein
MPAMSPSNGPEFDSGRARTDVRNQAEADEFRGASSDDSLSRRQSVQPRSHVALVEFEG